MNTRKQKFHTVSHVLTIVFVLATAFISTNCRKEISIPNPELEKLFGTWNWVQTYGGLGGQTTTPSTVGYSQTVEFSKKGIYKSFKNGKEQNKRKFTLTTGSSIYYSGTAFLISYKSIGIFSKKEYTSQSIKFGGEDTLFLNDEANDGFNNIFVRK